MMRLLKFFVFCFLLLSVFYSRAQTIAVPFYKGAIKANRDKTYTYIVNTSIIKNLSQPLNGNTEADWQDAFYALGLIRYKQPWVNEKIKMAFDGIENRSAGFQRAFMEMLYTNYTWQFKTDINKLFLNTKNAKVFAMCAAYLLRADKSLTNIDKTRSVIYNKKVENFDNAETASYILYELLWPIMQVAEKESNKPKIKLNLLINSNYLKGNTVVYSLQRKNRNFPGIVIVKDTNGNFIADDKGIVFSVPQLARSISNLPGYLTNGNTPQGIFRMHGFGTSKIDAIGTTENIQLTMPFETSVQHFLKDSTVIDSVWTKELYQQLLPKALQNYHPIFQSYYASAIGRTEIIAHGTTVDPEYYKGQIYYPLTPTEGCLCTKEIWSAADGKRTISNQQKLVDAVKKAGGADGYLIVIEIDDQQKPVSINEILPYLKKTK
jgi:hypothetical protein